MVEAKNAGPERWNATANNGSARRRTGGWARAYMLTLDDLAGMRALMLSPDQFRGVDGFKADAIAALGARREWQNDLAIVTYQQRADRTAFAGGDQVSTFERVADAAYGEALDGGAGVADAMHAAYARAELASFQAMRAMVSEVRHGRAAVKPPPQSTSARKVDHEVVNNHDKGTVGTRRAADKIRQCRIELLVRRGVLEVEHHGAANEIEMVMMAFARGLGLKASSAERSGGASRKPSDPLSRMQSHEYRAWREHYAPWAALMQAFPLMRRPERARGHDGEADRLQAFPHLLPMIIDVVCDNAGLSECDKRYGLRKGSAGDLLLLALHRYALISGAVRGPIWIENAARRLCGEI